MSPAPKWLKRSTLDSGNKLHYYLQYIGNLPAIIDGEYIEGVVL